MGTVERDPQQITGKTVVFAAIVGVAIGGPLIVLMAITFCATMALFLITIPLFIIFSPVLLGTIFVLVAAVVGLGISAVMAMAGLAAIGWALQTVRGDGGKVVAESGESVKDAGGEEWARHLKQKLQNGAAVGAH